jgi:hypothetical protein
MSEAGSDTIEELDPSIDPRDEERSLDHPDDVTDEEAQDGQIVYLEVDDTDDNSNGLD